MLDMSNNPFRHLLDELYAKKTDQYEFQRKTCIAALPFIDAYCHKPKPFAPEGVRNYYNYKNSDKWQELTDQKRKEYARKILETRECEEYFNEVQLIEDENASNKSWLENMEKHLEGHSGLELVRRALRTHGVMSDEEVFEAV